MAVPPKPIRLITGLLVLKHLRNVSDEQVVGQFSENEYYQYFCGMDAFSISAPALHPSLSISANVLARKALSLS
jgi:IS5 family transposase